MNVPTEFNSTEVAQFPVVEHRDALSLQAGEARDLACKLPALLLVEQGNLVIRQGDMHITTERGQLALLGAPTPVSLASPSGVRGTLFILDAVQVLATDSYVCNLDVLGAAAQLAAEVMEVTSVGDYVIGIRPTGLSGGDGWQCWWTLSGLAAPDGGGAEDMELVYRQAPLMPIKAPVDLAIIGAGPAGLSLAAHAAHHGLSVALFGEPMSFWKRSIVPLPLRSLPGSTNIDTPRAGYTYAEFAREVGLVELKNIPFHAFLAYAQRFLRGHGLCVNRTQVTGLSRAADVWHLRTPRGEWHARNVAVAVGLKGMERLPSAIASRRVPYTLASQLQSFSPYAGKRVAVLGAAQSAAEIALEAAAKCAEVHMLVRGSAIKYRSLHTPGNPAFKLLFRRADVFFQQLPAVLQNRLIRYLLKGTVEPGMRETIAASGVTVHTHVALDATASAVAGIRLDLGGGRELVVDHLVVATGYQYDVRRIPFLQAQAADGSLRHEGGLPVLSRHAEASLPGLYFAGLSALRMLGPQCQFVFGTSKVTPRIIERVLECR